MCRCCASWRAVCHRTDKTHNSWPVLYRHTVPPDVLMYCCTAEHEFVDPHTPTVKHIAGQAAYQLAVLYGLIFYAPALLGIPGG